MIFFLFWNNLYYYYYYYEVRNLTTIYFDIVQYLFYYSVKFRELKLGTNLLRIQILILTAF